MTKNLPQSRLKIKRANQHVYDLAREIRTYTDSHRLHVISKDNAETGQTEWRVYGIGTPPAHWPCIIGDAIHNMRSALDILVCELIRANGNTPTDKSAFPITWDKSSESFASKVEGITEPAKALIKLYKPYKGGNKILWSLHRLDILDKHKLIIPMEVAVPRMITLPMSKKFGSAFIEFPTTKPGFQDGDVIVSAPVGKLHKDPEVSVQISFGEVEIVAGKEIINTLNQLGDFIDDLICKFGREIFGEGS